MRKLRHIYLDYYAHVRAFSRDVKLFLISQAFLNFAGSLFAVFFNVYLKKGGLDEALIGGRTSIIVWGTVFFALPASFAVCKWGLRRAILWSFPLILAMMAFSAFTLSAWVLAALGLVSSFGSMLANAAQSPYLTANSSARTRHYVFSAWFALNSLTGVFGSLVGGFLPDIISALTNCSEFLALRYTIFSVCVVCGLGYVPLAKLRDNNSCVPIQMPSLKLSFDRATLLAARFPILQFIIGFGAGFTVPFLSIYFSSHYNLSASKVGIIFSVSSAITGFASMVTPLLVRRMGKLWAIILPQLISLPFIIVLAHSTLVIVSVFAWWIRTALMNASNPVWQQIIMEDTEEDRRPLINNVNTLFWNAGWAISVAISGISIKSFGYAPSFYTTFFVYLFYIWLTYRFLRSRHIVSAKS